MGRKFDITNAAALRGPAKSALNTYVVRQQDGKILVRVFARGGCQPLSRPKFAAELKRLYGKWKSGAFEPLQVASSTSRSLLKVSDCR
jgi:hypothetical protein